jgi:hypothetical protein
MDKGRPVHMDHNIIVNCDPTVYKIVEPLRLTTLSFFTTLHDSAYDEGSRWRANKILRKKN